MTQMKPTDDGTSLFETRSKPEEVTPVVSDSELWLSKHPDAKKSVLAALEEIKAGKFSEHPPNVDVDEAWMEELED